MNIKKILILAIFLVAIVGIIAPVSAAIESANKDKVYSIESKEKSVNNKVTWDANGGTVGSKKTISANVKKGSKIGKLPATPKRSGYTFSGWYTKKTGGSKISVNTKPSKAVIYYAQWKKVTPKNDDNSKFIGKWGRKLLTGVTETFNFKKDGTFTRDYEYSSGYHVAHQGKWKTSVKQAYSGNKPTLKLTSIKFREKMVGESWGEWKSLNDREEFYRFSKDSKGNHFQFGDSFGFSLGQQYNYYKL